MGAPQKEKKRKKETNIALQGPKHTPEVLQRDDVYMWLSITCERKIRDGSSLPSGLLSDRTKGEQGTTKRKNKEAVKREKQRPELRVYEVPQ
jgi:hypothetical protein